MTEAVEYDVVVLGGGPAGENAADRTRAAGLRTALVESELVGGECSYWACIPSKALLRPVLARADARRVPGLAGAVTGPLDTEAVLARRDEWVSHWKDDGQVSWIDSVDVHLYRGHGRLYGIRKVSVTGPEGEHHVLTAKHAVIVATGSRALLPDLPGLSGARPWTSREATSAQGAPGHLIVVGGSVVAVEMATAWQGLGSRVTVLARGPRLLPRMEEFAGELVAEALREAGAEVRTGVDVEAVVRDGSTGPVTAVLTGGETVTGDELLMATGRLPRTEDIGLDTVGLEPGAWIDVDESCRVPGHDWLYAVGDVNHRALLTHQGKYQARIAGAAIAARARSDGNGAPVDETPWGPYTATADTRAVPQVVFTDPEAAAVGPSLAEARRAGLRVRAVDHDLGAVAGAGLHAEGYRGRARILVDLDRGVLVGATFVGPGAAELVHAATVAVVGEVPLARLWHAVPAFPTLSEIWLRLLERLRDEEAAEAGGAG
ncbi:dihydrolipoyl dehydrogenase family protein [Streptomyces sp. BI20]|uniref:dihydrolipoyl dehydrogenase family protein n=1 Tax=Streptomyces sp. BI20 TaxID=3403460 RepID=UPI003C7531A7